MRYYFWFAGFATLFVFNKTLKPSDKEQQVVWRLECELGLIVDPECPVDGGWSPWIPWSPCYGTCDEVGHRHRNRECINPRPSQDGLPCTGAEHQTEQCYLTNCTTEDYRKLIAGDAIRREALQQLEAVPALIDRCLQMECSFEAIEAALISDNTWQINSEVLWNSLQCVKHNLGCPVIGEWGSWGKWSACGARCGYGLRWRLRKCDTPPPSNAHLICVGSPLEVDECQGDQCALNKRDSGGSWGKWGQWSACSENCGAGVRFRKRNCLEINTPRLFGSWGTHCRGQHDQVEVCESRECKLDGEWSGWGAWGPCSQSCGPGRRSRSRSCTRPVPAGSGTFCVGPRIEVGSCHLAPCETYSHTVTVFNGESLLQYKFENKRSTLFQFYVRFLPLSPHGTLVRRGTRRNPLVRLRLQKWHLCFEAGGLSRSCTGPIMCSPTVIEPAVWHSALITVTNKDVSLRLDDEPLPIRSTFSCDPDLPNDKVDIYVGERLHGEVQELSLNFIPLCMIIKRVRVDRLNFCPSAGSNVAYENAGAEEAYLHLDNNKLLRLPCFVDQEEWQIKMTLRSKTETGIIMFMEDEHTHNSFLLYIKNMRLKLKLALADFRSESISSSDYPPDQWFDITISKKRETNTITASINAGERLHVVIENDFTRRVRMYANNSITETTFQKPYYSICSDEYFVGGIPGDVRTYNAFEDITSLSGIIASISVNNVLLDLNDHSVEWYRDGKTQVSSKTASVSGSYHETAWGRSNHLNLTCLHARTSRVPNTAHWLYLDTVVSGALKDKAVRSVDDGRVLRLVATADNDLRGFYTCRAHSNKRTKNIVTYGVLGKIEYKLTGPDMTTALAVVTTLALVLGTLTWLFIEGIHDIHNGYGFFRDAHLSPGEEAEAVCKYIDQNMHLFVSKSAAVVAKAKARQIGTKLASRSSFAAQEPEGLIQVENFHTSNESIPSELEDLPALPEIQSLESSHDVYRCEQSYISSPRHGSISSPKTKLTSSSSYEMSSPKVLCSRLLLAKHLSSSRESLASRNNKLSRGSRKSKSKLLTIKSSTSINQSPAQRILQKFHELKSDDI